MSRFGLMVLALFFIVADVSGQTWELAHATFYGNDTGEETMQGACGGYGDLFKQGCGLETTALSTALFDNGSTCGACFAIRCVNSKWCVPGQHHHHCHRDQLLPPRPWTSGATLHRSTSTCPCPCSGSWASTKPASSPTNTIASHASSRVA
ncbi:hypothetical protein AAC387_Pa02g1452 [Persea americana]